MASSDASPWPTVTLIGVLCGITFGLVLYSLLRREEGGLLPSNDLGLGALPVVNTIPTVKAVPIVGKSRPSAARSMTISATKPTMILRAVGGNWRVSVRVLSPAGAFATFIIGKETDSSIIVPAGSSQDLWLPEGHYLYAKGNVPGMCVSASGGGV